MIEDLRSRYLAPNLASDVSRHDPKSCDSDADKPLGFPFSFGIFQDYYSTHAPFSKEPSGIAVIGTSAMVWLFNTDVFFPFLHALLTLDTSIKGIMYLGSPFSFALLQRFPLYRRHCAVLGLFIMVIGLVASSFATRVSHLILTQGVLYAIGGSMLYTPTIIFLDEWFVARKGLAFGVMWAGTGNNHPCLHQII